MSYCLAYMTAASAERAKAIGRVLVEERLAACVNVIPGMTAIYRWEGAVEEDGEAVLIAKTRDESFEVLTARVEALHDYDNPCVIRLDIAAGRQPFLDWIAAETT